MVIDTEVKLARLFYIPPGIVEYNAGAYFRISDKDINSFHPMLVWAQSCELPLGGSVKAALVKKLKVVRW